ncbi:hypothetical protein PFISCL1PPCAC_17975 [Pristionchus fissidentatus]|uniref:Phosphoserine aminotransferase n=1 Tax=Pristionchus fissidentatus TaxID=1538716 RepID=A0AAV5W7I8_9BILA|nr:hypothetical protein PFISCL1PPCAC_17975 [Pristionchus fissidentatus]
MASKKINFGAGPAKIPEAVMEKAAREFLVYGNSGVSILEMSHRSSDFTAIIKEAEKLMREEMSIPNEFEVLFMQGGGTGQFAAIPMNIARGRDTADYAVTGTWSDKAGKEAEKYINVRKVFPSMKPYTTIPDYGSWDRKSDAAYLYYCANETVHGVEFHTPPETHADVPLVADISSNFLSRPFDFANHGIVFGGTQKNLGAAGLTVALVRKDLIGHESRHCPSILSYKEMHTNNSVYNTPSVYGIYITKLVLEWIRDTGGVNKLFTTNQEKSRLMYETIDGSDGFFSCPVDAAHRSHMNVPFRIGGGDESLEAAFLKGATERGMVGLKGHRSVGGIRASIYNAVTLDETKALVDWMNEFETANRK